MTKVRELAERINEALQKDAVKIMSSVAHGGQFDARASNAERISIIERLIAAEYPTVESGLPKPSNKLTDPERLSAIMLTDSMVFVAEGMLMRSTTEQTAHSAKYHEALKAQLISFKRAVRDEALAEYADGATKADEMLGASLGTRSGK